MKRVKNAGLTLVELLVSVAVLSIVTLGIGGLLRLAAEQYSNATKETEVQNQTQSVFASVSNALEDVAIDVTFTGSRLTIVNKDKCILFELDNGILYYDEKNYVTDLFMAEDNDDSKKAVSAVATMSKNTENILADHVTAFSVDTSTKDQGFVVVSMTVTLHERSKSMVQNVFMRNLRPKGSSVVLNSTTNAVSPTPTQLQMPSITITGEAGHGGESGETPTSTPTPEPTSTPTPTPEDHGNTMVASNQHVYNDGKAISFSFDRLFNGETTSHAVNITKNDRNEYVIHGVSDAVKGLFNSSQENGNITIPSMPGFSWGPNEFVLTEAQIEWLKAYYGVDLIVSCPPTPLPAGSSVPPQTQLTGLVYTEPANTATISVGNSLGWNGDAGPYPVTITTSGNDKIYSVIIKVTGAASPSINESGLDYRYDAEDLGGGRFRVYFNNGDNQPVNSIVPYVVGSKNQTVAIESIEVYRD
jgi:prepilin-type N-terminal cleavage/methylation domain-containing protein